MARARMGYFLPLFLLLVLPHDDGPAGNMIGAVRSPIFVPRSVGYGIPCAPVILATTFFMSRPNPQIVATPATPTPSYIRRFVNEYSQLEDDVKLHDECAKDKPFLPRLAFLTTRTLSFLD